MAVLGGLTNSCEKKRREKQRRKGKIHPSECRGAHISFSRSVVSNSLQPHGLQHTSLHCREPAWESPPMTRSCGRVLVGKGSQNSRGAPLGLPERLPPNQNLFYYFTTFTNSSDINGGLSPTTFLCKKISLKL